MRVPKRNTRKKPRTDSMSHTEYESYTATENSDYSGSGSEGEEIVQNPDDPNQMLTVKKRSTMRTRKKGSKHSSEYEPKWYEFGIRQLKDSEHVSRRGTHKTSKRTTQ
jgi:hypothetical protein